ITLNILLTGSTGFVGRAVLAQLLDEKSTVTAVVRDAAAIIDARADKVLVEGLSIQTDWREVLQGQAVIIHSAARVHIMDDLSADPLVEFRKINVDGTLKLARQAAAAGVMRFVFISSIKVNGEATAARR